MTTATGTDGNAGTTSATGAAGSTATASTASTASTATAIDYKFDPIEGVTPEFDADVIATAKEMGWDQATAAKFRAREAKLALDELKAEGESRAQKQAADKIAKEQADLQRKQAWEKANRDHPEFGGQKYHETGERITQLLARFDTDKSFAKELEQAPELLAHPAFRGFLARIAYATADGKFHEAATGQQSNEPKSFADVAYGNKYPAAAR